SSILKNGTKVEDGYVVGINKELEHAIDGEKITPEDVKAYRERPEVQKALKDNPKAFIGTWVDGGKTYFDTSIPEPDLETAKKLGKANEQKAIFDAVNKVPISLEDRNYPKGYPEGAKEGGTGPLPEVGGGSSKFGKEGAALERDYEREIAPLRPLGRNNQKAIGTGETERNLPAGYPKTVDADV